MDAILAQASSQLPLSSEHELLKQRVYLCPPQNYTGTTPELLIGDAVTASSHFSPFLTPQLRPRGWSSY